MNISFFFRISQGKVKAEKQLGSITYLITQKDTKGTKTIEKQTGLKCHRTEWNDDEKCFVGTNAMSKNIHLEKIKLEFERKVNQNEATQTELQTFVDFVKPVVKLKLFTDVYNEYIEFQKLKIRKDDATRTKMTIEQSTFDTYKKRYKNIESFLTLQKRLNMNVSKFDALMCEKLDLFLTSNANSRGQKRGQEYSTKHIKLVQAVVEFARKCKYVTINSTRDYELKYSPQTSIKTISNKALENLESFTGFSKIEQKYVDAFLFMRECLIHVGDYLELDDSHFDIDENGKYWIIKQRIKREVDGRQIQMIPLSQKAIEILNKYDSNFDGALSKLPRAKNAAIIRYYVKIANARCNNTEYITLKYARSNGISNLYNNNKSRAESIAIVAGLTTTKQLKAYLKIDFNELRKEVLSIA
jgi:integrase